jgi:hypothetical protein
MHRAGIGARATTPFLHLNLDISRCIGALFFAFSIIAGERKKCLMLAKLTIVADAPSDLAWPELLLQNGSFHWELQKIARFTCSAKQRRCNCIGEN